MPAGQLAGSELRERQGPTVHGPMRRQTAWVAALLAPVSRALSLRPARPGISFSNETWKGG